MLLGWIPVAGRLLTRLLARLRVVGPIGIGVRELDRLETGNAVAVVVPVVYPVVSRVLGLFGFMATGLAGLMGLLG